MKECKECGVYDGESTFENTKPAKINEDGLCANCEEKAGLSWCECCEEYYDSDDYNENSERCKECHEEEEEQNQREKKQKEEIQEKIRSIENRFFTCRGPNAEIEMIAIQLYKINESLNEKERRF